MARPRHCSAQYSHWLELTTRSSFSTRAYDSYEAGDHTRRPRALCICHFRARLSVSTSTDCEDSLSERTRLVVINTPHNPTGTLVSAADRNRLAEVLAPYDCFVISDEV